MVCNSREKEIYVTNVFKRKRFKRRESTAVTHEIIAFDLRAVFESTSRHADIKAFLETCRPAYFWGVLTTACTLRLMKGDVRRRKIVTSSGLFDFTGETNRQRDLRVIESMKSELLEFVPQFASCDDALLKMLYELRPAYYRLNEIGTETKPICQRRSYFLKSLPPAHSFDQLVSARDDLQQVLNELYASEAFINTNDDPKMLRLRVSITREGLSVMVTLTHEEAQRIPPGVGEISLDDFIEMIPTTWQNCPVSVENGYLDESATGISTSVMTAA
jgi:hypothetical protein